MLVMPETTRRIHSATGEQGKPIETTSDVARSCRGPPYPPALRQPRGHNDRQVIPPQAPKAVGSSAAVVVCRSISARAPGPPVDAKHHAEMEA